MNILLTCAGRRNYLVEYFRQALAGRGLVCVADASAEAPSMQESDLALVVPKVSDPAYFDRLLEICRGHAIGLLVSLNDLELPRLARQRERFLEVGTLPVISSPEAVDLCFDKWRTLKFLREHDQLLPRTYLQLGEACAALARGDISFPLVVKPRWGSASIGIEYPDDVEELELAYRLVRKRLTRTILSEANAADLDRCVMIQERLHGQEYGLDVVNDFDGHYVTTFAKRKLAMRAGETDRACTEAHEGLLRLGETLGRTLKHRGNLDCDVFVSGNDCYVLEMNPRFGGGYPFSHVAGANLPAALVAWAQGQQPDPAWFTVEPGVRAAKCDRLVVSVEAQRGGSEGICVRHLAPSGDKKTGTILPLHHSAPPRLKHTFDILCAVILLILLAPVMLAVAIAIACRMGRPIIFRQRRIGLGEREFSIFKFRTMTNERGSDGELLPDEQRATGVGRFLRTASLDELPQLWNVLLGDMSLVGPRPLYVKYLPYYTERECLRHTVRPGITGLAQISGRNLLSWDDRLELDAQYVERQSFLYDLAILVGTLQKVVKRSGVALQAIDDLDVARCTLVDPPSWGTVDPTGASASEDDASLAAAGDRSDLGDNRRDIHRNIIISGICDLTNCHRNSGNY